MEAEEGPEAKRRKGFTKNEALEKLKESGDNVNNAVKQIVSELTPFDLNDENIEDFEVRIQKLEEVSDSLKKKVYRLKTEVKAKKFKHHPEYLEETFGSCSQYSVLQSEDSESLCDNFSQQSLEPAEPTGYKKRPLNSSMDPRSRRRRVSEKRDILVQWAKEEGVSLSELLGFFLHLENWNNGDKSIAAIGWKIFMSELVPEKSVMTVEEAIWLIERSGMSQAVYLETRLRLLNRIYMPPVMYVRAENQRHRPALTEYKHGVKAPLMQCLQLTLSERLEQMDFSGLDQTSLKVMFKIGWGLDGSGEHSDYHQLSKVSYTTKQVMSICFL